MDTRILLVEEEETICHLMAEVLEGAGYHVVGTTDGRQALRAFFVYKPDIVLLGAALSSIDSWDLCYRFRELSDVPIIVVSGSRSEEWEKAYGFNQGAGGNIVKPFGTDELVALVKSAIGWSPLAPPSADRTYSDPALCIDFGSHEIWVRGQIRSFSPTEFRLLACLVEHTNRVVTREELLRRVWGENYDSLENVKVYIGYLRKKVEDDPANPQLILSVRGAGYRYKKPEAIPTAPEEAKRDKASS